MPRQDDVGLALTYYRSCWAQPIREAIKKVNLITGLVLPVLHQMSSREESNKRLDYFLGTSIGIRGQASSLANHVLFCIAWQHNGSTYSSTTQQQCHIHNNDMIQKVHAIPASARFMIVGRRQQAVVRVSFQEVGIL